MLPLKNEENVCAVEWKHEFDARIPNTHQLPPRTCAVAPAHDRVIRSVECVRRLVDADNPIVVFKFIGHPLDNFRVKELLRLHGGKASFAEQHLGLLSSWE